MTLTQSRDVYDSGPARGWLPWGILAPVLCILMVAVSLVPGTLLLGRFIPLDANDDPVNGPGLVAFLVVPFGLLLAVLSLWVRGVERRSAAALGVVGGHKLADFFRGHAFGLLSALFVVGGIWAAGGVSTAGPAAWGRAWSSPSALATIALLLPAFALQSSVEELLFRGWLLSLLAKKLNLAVGVLVSSAVFALLHFHRGQPGLVTLSTFLFGLFLACWSVRSRSVLGAMGWHSAWNWLIAVGFGLPITGIDVGIPPLLVGLRPVGAPWLTGGADGPEGSVVCVAFFLIGIVGLLLPGRAPSAVEAANPAVP